MDRVDYVLDSAPNDDLAYEMVTKMARENHGSEAIEAILNDTSLSDDQAYEAVTKAARYKPNMENTPLIDVPYLRDVSTPENWYKVAKDATIAAKPFAMMTTPITEALRAPFKYAAENFGENTSQTPPIDTTAEVQGLHLSDRAGAGLLIRDMANSVGIKGSALGNIQSENFPKAAEFLNQMTDPINVAGAATDIMAGKAVAQHAPKFGVVSSAASATEDMKNSWDWTQSKFTGKEKYDPRTKYEMVDNTYVDHNGITKSLGVTDRIKNIDTPDLRQMVMTNEHPTVNMKTALTYIESITKDKKLLMELKKSGKIYDIARRIVAEPEKYLKQFKPESIYDTIQGGVDQLRGKRSGQGELDRLMQSQENLLENLLVQKDPRTGKPLKNYTVPAEELHINAQAELGNMGQMEAGQARRASEIVSDNIPVEQADPVKMQRIKDVIQARYKAKSLGRQEGSEMLSLQEQIRQKKASLIAEIEAQPDLINNPAYREELQWYKSMEYVVDGDVFPKEHYANTTQMGPVPPSQQPIKPSQTVLGDAGPTLGFEPDGPVMTPKMEPEFVDSFESASPALNPENVALNGSKSYKEKLHAMSGGAHLEPKMIPNPAKQLSLEKAIERFHELNQDLKNLNERPVSSVRNQKLLEMRDERARLQGFIEDNFDKSMLAPEYYTEHIQKLNEKPAGYATSIRRLGNKLMDPAIPGEVSTDVAARNAAGRAMERAGRKSEQTIISSADMSDQMVYNGQNKKISDLIDLRDLTSGNLNASGVLDDVYLPGSPTGTTGMVGAISRGMDRYIKPTFGETKAALANASNVYGTSGGIKTGAATMAANEFVYSKTPVNSYKIPRTTQEAAEQADMVIMKLKREFGKEAADAFQQATSREEVATLFGNLSRLRPDVFAQSKFMAIDGKTSDPIMKQMALEEVIKTKGASAFEDAQRAEGIINHGIVE